MKKILPLVVAFAGCLGFGQVIAIPDANFKAKLLAASPANTTATNNLNAFIKIDANDNNEIEAEEALQVKTLNVSIAGIGDMAGIEAFANLRTLNCNQNRITSLAVGNLSNLKSLYCNLNLLSTLDLSDLPGLLNLECAENVLTTIDFAEDALLQTLSCRFNFLTSLDTNSLENLSSLNCDYNRLASLDISGLNQLTDLACQSNQLTHLSLTNQTSLTSLNCSYNQLATLDVHHLNTLTQLNCSHNQITNLDLTQLANLSLLNCEFNQIGNAVVLSGMNDLQSAYCHQNLIPSFTFADLPSLQVLDCSHNPISALDASPLPQLMVLNCHDNSQLTQLNIHNGSTESFLDFSDNPNLLFVCADENQLTTVENLIDQYGYSNCQAASSCNLALPEWEVAFELYPNPAKEAITFTNFDGLRVQSFLIYNSLGQLVLTVGNPKATIAISALPAGNYFIRLVTEKGTFAKKFIKQ